MDVPRINFQVKGPRDAPRLRKRINIFIQRSDGRVHEASISDIDYEKQNVVVEWIENGETKGKSIDFPFVFDLNPELLTKHNVNSNDRETVNGNEEFPNDDFNADLSDEDDDMLVVNVPPSDDVANEDGLEEISLKTATEDAQVKVAMAKLPGAPQRPPSAKNPRAANPAVARRVTSVMHDVGGKNGGPSGEARVGAREKDKEALGKSISNEPRHGASKSMPANQAAAKGAQQSARERKVETSPRPSLPGNQARMSNCARQIKKLEQSRVERRQKMEEAKQEKQKQMNVDPGNPNWNFLHMIREYRSTLDFTPLTLQDVAQDKQINVCVRKRPLSKKEEAKKELDVISIPSKDVVMLHECRTKVDLTKYLDHQTFRFDYAFDDDATNELVYKFTAQPLIQTVLDGGMATCFAYGQTGSGKTHTMGGNFSGKGQQDCSSGLYALAARDIFRALQRPKHKKDGLIVRASFFEIYGGKVFDLLNKKKKLRILEDGDAQVVVCDLQEKEVRGVEDVLSLLQVGNAVRTSGQTAANAHSSRSHAVFQMILRTRNDSHVHGKFSFVDLAGNERGVDQLSANRQTRLEGAEINKSLLALKECIRALARKGAHLPFRASKLTQVLRDSFIGVNSRTCMIATISPGLSCAENTLNTLRYAYRVKELDGSESNRDVALPIGSGTWQDDPLMETLSSAASDLASLEMENASGSAHSDLQQLESLNALREAEEDVLEGQRLMVDALDEFAKKTRDLQGISNEVDYDVDEFAEQMQQTLNDYDEIFVPLMEEFRRKFARFRQELAAEEELSRSLSGATPAIRK